MQGKNDSRIAENILLFCRTLRQSGLAIGPGQVIDAAAAVLRTGIERREDFYHALRAVLVTDPNQFRLFDQAFHIYFRNPRLLERMMGLLLPTLEQERVTEGGDPAILRLLEALSSEAPADSDTVVVEIDPTGSSSRREVLQKKDFEQMSLEELREARQMLRDGVEVMRRIPTRRFRPDRLDCLPDG